MLIGDATSILPLDSFDDPDMQGNSISRRSMRLAVKDVGIDMSSRLANWDENLQDTVTPSITELTSAFTTPDSTGNSSMRHPHMASVDRASDQRGWQTIATWQQDNIAPSVALLVNNGEEKTRSLDVTLHLREAVSSDRGNWTGWEPYAVDENWQLVDQSAEQTVYTQVQDRAGNESAVYTANVIAHLNLDRPSSASYRLARSVVAMGGGTKISTSYQIRGTSGQSSGVGRLVGASYTVYSGFWPGAAPLAGKVYLPLVLRAP